MKTTYTELTKEKTGFSNRVASDLYRLLDLVWEDDGSILLDEGYVKPSIDYSDQPKSLSAYSDFDKSVTGYAETAKTKGAYSDNANKNRTDYNVGLPIFNEVFVLEDSYFELSDGTQLLLNIGYVKNTIDYQLTDKDKLNYTVSDKSITNYTYSPLVATTLDSDSVTLSDMAVRLHGYLTISPPSRIDSKNKTSYEEV